jgi:hypothetical protein
MGLPSEPSSLDSTGLSIAVETVYMKKSGRKDMSRQRFKPLPTVLDG